MRHTLLIIGFTVFSMSAYAQFVPNSNQAFQFMSFYNPAFSGIDPFHDIRFGYRYQWAGFEGAPEAAYLSFNTRLKQPFDITTNALRISNPKAVIIPMRKLISHGLNVNVFTLTYGQIKTGGAGINYALHIPLTKKLNLSTGFGALLEKTSLDLNGITVSEQDAYFNSLLGKGNAATNFNLQTGIVLYSHNFYVGISYLPLFRKAITPPEGSENNNLYNTASMQFGFAFPAGPNFMIKPSVLLLRYNNDSNVIDYSVKAYLHSNIWFGLSYRSIQGGVALLGFNINRILNVAYTYELSLGKFKTVNNGSHEFVLGIKMNNFKRQEHYTW